MILSFPWKSFIKAEISAKRGNKKKNKTTNKVTISPPQKRKRKLIFKDFD